MRNLPCPPKGKREGSGKGCCHTISKHRAWWTTDCQPASSACQRHHRPGPGRSPVPPSVSGYLTGQSGSRCLVVILIIYSRYYKSSPCEVSAAHSPVQTCSRQTPQTWRLAVKQHTANRSNECEGRGGKKISKKEGVTPACFV